MKLQVGVKILLEQNERYLMLRRAEIVDHGGERVYDIPGGGIDTDEPLLEALSREVAEETGLVLSPSIKLLTAQDIFVPSKDLHVVRLTYTGTAEGSVTLSDEHDTYTWMTRAQILALETLDPYLREIV